MPKDSRENITGLTRRRLVQSLAATPLLAVPGLADARAGVAMTLDGVWQCALDPHDAGISGSPADRPSSGNVHLAGSLEQGRVGNPVAIDTPWTGDIHDRSFFEAPEYAPYREPGHIKVPFFLQPESWYRGAAWYRREITIPRSWRDKRIELFLERPHWETQVWIDDRLVGRNDALHVAHRYDLGCLKPGRHRLAIRVDNRMVVEIGHNGHGVTDHTQGNWNGIAGRIELRATEPVWIDRVDLYPSLIERTLTVRGRVGRTAATAGTMTADIAFAGHVKRVPVTWQKNGRKNEGTFEAAIVPDAGDTAAMRPWDEFDPVLHDVAVRLSNGEAWQGRFGWRELTPTPEGFRLNGRPAMFRGALECSIFPLTGHPATDIGSWRHIMRRAKAYGLNHLRFHSYCPPEAAFDAADEVGLYLQIETVWANQSVKIGSGLPVDRWVYAETDRILAAHGNHPSFMLMTHGNEPGGAKERDAFLAAYVRHYRDLDGRRLWTSGSGWPVLDENQYHVTPTPRVQGWGEELKSRINGKPPETETDYGGFVGKYPVPVISHEIGQWCVYPNLDETPKYTGYLKAKNFEIFADRLRASGLHGHARDFLHASGRLQVLCYKEDIESALRTAGMGGFQLLGLQDFPGQGTALVGVVDPFWDDKGYVTGEQYRRFCAPTVALARLKTRIVQSGTAFAFSVDVAHFGAMPIEDADITWRVISADGVELAKGTFPRRTLPLGNAPLGLSAAPVLAVSRATAARLEISIGRDGTVVAQNDWDLWVYPDIAGTRSAATGIRRANRIDADLLAYLRDGGDALIGLPGASVANYEKQPVKLGFSSIFWNTLWTQQQAPTTLGILCDPRHAALADFPTEPHSNWQWWYLLHRAGALRLDLLPPGIDPIVRVIDDWFTARPLGLVVELAVGKGRAIVCGFAVDGPDATDPVSRQLVSSLERYMTGPAFRPSTPVSVEQLARLAAGAGV